MTDPGPKYFIYWDSSAILSTLLKDKHSDQALKWVRKGGVHFLSTLAYAEIISVLDRLEKERILTRILAQSAFQALVEGPWRFLNVSPARECLDSLQGKYSLRGADYWHLAMARTLKRDIPELMLFSFDHRLQAGAEKEGLGLEP